MGQGAGALPTEAYTPWLKRVIAALIDSIPIIVLEVIAQGVQLATASSPSCTTTTTDNTYSTSCSGGGSAVGTIVGLIVGLLVLAYAIWNWGYKQGTTGQSIGKGVMKFKVVSEATGQPIGFGMSIVRQIAHFVDAIICYIGYLFPLWDAKRQTLADKIMSTVCLPSE